MHPKIDPQQHLTRNSEGQFSITGPTGPWEDDDAAVIFTLVISQVAKTGIAVGIGASDPYYPGASRWTALAKELPENPALQPGGALVFAWASIAQPDGGWEMYPWGRPVTLS
jgi:hypothetical protein